MVGTRADALESFLNFKSKNSAKGLHIKDSLVTTDDNLSGSILHAT